MEDPFLAARIAAMCCPNHYEPKIMLTDINKVSGLKTQVRIVQPLDMDHVDQLTKAINAGHPMPPFVLWRLQSGHKWTPGDGNHRLEAMYKARVRPAHHDAYVLDSTDLQVIRGVIWTLNQHGKSNEEEDNIFHAAYFVLNYGYTQVKAAERFCVSLPRLTLHLKQEEIKRILAEQGVKKYKTLSNEAVAELYRLKDSGPDVVAKAAEVIVSNGITTNQIHRLVDTVKAAPSTKKIEAVVNFSQQPDVKEMKAVTQGGETKTRASTPKVQFNDLLYKLTRLTEKFAPDVLVPRESQFDEQKHNAQLIVQKLIKIFGAGVLEGPK